MTSPELNSLLDRLAQNRGLNSATDLKTDLSDLLAPNSMLGLRNAAELLFAAINKKERITIVADYDCDGATACAVLLRGLVLMGAIVEFFVPNRFEFGYGLSEPIVDHLANNTDQKPRWLITVDNGIASVDGVARANALGMSVIITDHHLPGETLPAAAAIVNPNQAGCEFPSKCIAGVGVAFYLLIALRAIFREQDHAAGTARIQDLVDLVALGTVADLVRLDHNNRVLVQAGLARMRSGKAKAGLIALAQVAGREMAHLSSTDLGFALGPRINAAGRLAEMEVGIQCLITDDLERAHRLATALNETNAQRKQVQAEMTAQAVKIAQSLSLVGNSAGLCVFHDTWHQGVVGLVASTLKDSTGKPCFAFAPANDGTLRGSGRSISGLHLRDALDWMSKQAPNLLIRFGGHAMAAGLSLERSQLEKFTELFEFSIAALMVSDQRTSARLDDGSLPAELFNFNTAKHLEEIVWGQGFASPLFVGQFSVVSQRLIKEQHLLLDLKFLDNRRVKAWYFGRRDTLPDQVNLRYSLVADRWGQKQETVLHISSVV
jgi:single-stranded-DNA-specific exonuclease